LLELFVADDDLRDHVRRSAVLLDAADRHRSKGLLERFAKLAMLEIAGSGNDDVLGRVGAPEMVAQPLLGERLDALFGPKDRPAQRMALPERLGENLVDEVVRRVLDHLDLFEDDLLLAFDVALVERGAKDDVRQDVDRKRQMLVEHLDVIARVLFGGKRVELAANGVDRLGDLFRRA
jgi:hypothetical protein